MTKLKVAKSGINAETATDPNDFIYHSDYNTFKILETGLYEPTIPANTSLTTYSIAHGKEYVPLVMAFMREDTIAEAVMTSNFSPNALSHLTFESVSADYTNIYFSLANDDFSNSHVAHIRYFIFEVPL